ncbi:MAG: glycosyltransferase family 4 protein [Candidatus Helarchaeota archaeon]
MRILFIAKYSPKSSRLWGGEIHIIKLAEELAKKNVKIFFINSDYTGIINNVQYIKLPYKKYRKTPYNAEFNHLIRIIKKLKIDIINTFSTNGVLIKKLKKKLNIPIIHSQFVWRLDVSYKIRYPFAFLLYGKPFIYLAYLFELKGLNNADYVIVTSRVLKKFVKYYTSQKNVQVIPRGVDIDLFKPSPYPNSNNIIAITLGRLDKAKGVQDIIKAFKILKNKKINIKLLIFGVGPYLNSLKKLTKKYDLDEIIKFYGTIPHKLVPKVLKNSHFLISASWFEGFGGVLLEEMACSRPFITTKNGGSADIIKENINGLSVKIKSPRDMADKIEYLAKNHSKAEIMGINGRKIVEKQFNWKNEANSYLKFYKKVLKNSNK